MYLKIRSTFQLNKDFIIFFFFFFVFQICMLPISLIWISVFIYAHVLFSGLVDINYNVIIIDKSDWNTSLDNNQKQQLKALNLFNPMSFKTHLLNNLWK